MTPETPNIPKSEAKPVNSDLFNEILDRLTTKSPEEINKLIAEGKWPFDISEEQMRADLAEMNRPKDTRPPTPKLQTVIYD